jgi:hypothetical protein
MQTYWLLEVAEVVVKAYPITMAVLGVVEQVGLYLRKQYRLSLEQHTI